MRSLDANPVFRRKTVGCSFMSMTCTESGQSVDRAESSQQTILTASSARAANAGSASAKPRGNRRGRFIDGEPALRAERSPEQALAFFYYGGVNIRPRQAHRLPAFVRRRPRWVRNLNGGRADHASMGARLHFAREVVAQVPFDEILSSRINQLECRRSFSTCHWLITRPTFWASPLRFPARHLS